MHAPTPPDGKVTATASLAAMTPTVKDPERTISVYAVDSLPVELCDTVIAALTGWNVSLATRPVQQWHVKNKYYSTTLDISWTDSEAQFRQSLASGSPAAVVMLDCSKPIDSDWLRSLDPHERLQVMLVLGLSGSRASREETISAEDHEERCTEGGYWEYIDLSHISTTGSLEPTTVTEDSALSRLSAALQAHTWPAAALAKPAAAAEPAKSPVSIHVTSGFDDDFSAFVDSSTAQHENGNERDVQQSRMARSTSTPNASQQQHDHRQHDYRHLSQTDDYDDEQQLLSRLASGNDADGNEDEDPTAALTSLFMSLSGLRERASEIQDSDARKDFAEQAALRFARQLDLMLAKEDEERQDEGGESGLVHDDDEGKGAMTRLAGSHEPQYEHVNDQ